MKLGDSSRGARVDLVHDPAGGVTLEVVIPDFDHAAAQELAGAAHKVGPYSRATSGNIPVTMIVTDD